MRAIRSTIVIATLIQGASAGLSILASGLSGPHAIISKNASHFVVSTVFDSGLSTIDKSTGEVVLFSGAEDVTLLYPEALVLGKDGSVLASSALGYVIQYAADGLSASAIIGDGSLGFPATSSPMLGPILPPTALLVDAVGNTLVGDASGHVHRAVASTETLSTLVGTTTGIVTGGCFPPARLSAGSGLLNGDGGKAGSALFGSVAALSYGVGGKSLLIADKACGVVRRSSVQSTTITTIAGAHYTSVSEYSVDDEGAHATAVSLDEPAGVISTPEGNIIIAQTGCIRLVRQCDGAIVTIAGTCGQPADSTAGVTEIAALIDAASAAGATVDPLEVKLSHPTGLYLSTSDNVLSFTDRSLGGVFSFKLPEVLGCPPSPSPTASTKKSNGVRKATAPKKGPPNRGTAALCGHGGHCHNRGPSCGHGGPCKHKSVCGHGGKCHGSSKK